MVMRYTRESGSEIRDSVGFAAMVFDDYDFPSCPGARIAVDEFFFDKPEFPIVLPSGQCVVIKI
jgi:hypothetical protein